MTGKWKIYGVIGMVCALGVTFPACADEGAYTVEIAPVEDYKPVIATVESVHETQARARINGTLSVVSVREGDFVQAGDKIAVVGDVKLGLQNQGLRARIQAAEAALSKARQDNGRAEELLRQGYATRARVDETRAALDIAENNLKAVQAEEKVVVQQADEGAVLAPAAGRVLKVPVTAGSVVMAGEVIAVLSQSNYVLRVELPERHARFMHVGDKVSIGTRGLEPDNVDKMKPGTVVLVYPEIKDGRVIADVRADSLGDYFVGERVRAVIATGMRQTIMVPRAYVFRHAGVDFARLADGTDVVVQTGADRGGQIEILSGLRAGDKLIKP